MQSMSKPFLLIIAIAVVLLQSSSKCAAQDTEVTLRVQSDNSVIHVEGKFLKDRSSPSQPLIFLSDYGGIHLSPDRISNVKHSGKSWSYDVNVAPTKNPSAAAHVSWFTKGNGILMLADLLPQQSLDPRQTAKVFVVESPISFSYLPWIATSEKKLEDGSYAVRETEKAVFFLGFDSFYKIDTPSRYEGPGLHTADIFQPTPSDALNVADEVYREYRGLFRATRPNVEIGIANLPGQRSQGSWEASTRGKTITVITSETVFKSQALQQLHEQLRHEMFHLWIPEGVNLTGNYDWFYEGFAVYQSLKLGVAVNRIRFDDYLDTLSRAYDIDRRLGGKLSLIDASKNRWSADNNTVVYSRGMLVAFLCDLALMDVSKGKRSTDDIVREVYLRHSGQAPEKDGNEAVISILKEHRELTPIVDAYVSGAREFEWTDLIRTAGLQADTKSGVTALTVIPKPSGRQKRLLDKLGYNNWRKLSSK